jgi:RimJ/RimL family protein N-acetyltransferase
MPWIKHEPTDLQAKIATMRRFRGNFDQGVDFVYGVFNIDETLVIGGTGLHKRLAASEWAPTAREIGYWIHKEYLNKGLATELSAALTKVAFEIEKVDRVEILCDPENIRSSTVPRKLGYDHEATLRQRTFTTDGRPRDTMIWSLFASEYPASPSAQAEIQAYDAMGRGIL